MALRRRPTIWNEWCRVVTPWAPTELEVNALERERHEGWGEKGYKLRNDLSQKVTSKSWDFPEIKEEGKCIQTGLSKTPSSVPRNSLLSFKLGKFGTEAYGSLIWHVATHYASELTEGQRQRVMRGEIPPNELKQFSTDVREYIMNVTVPSLVMSEYKALVLTSLPGFLRIPNEHFDSAFEMRCITKMGPKFWLRTDYLISLPTYEPAGEATPLSASSSHTSASDQQVGSPLLP